jgi:hypothetical protein
MQSAPTYISLFEVPTEATPRPPVIDLTLREAFLVLPGIDVLWTSDPCSFTLRFSNVLYFHARWHCSCNEALLS